MADVGIMPVANAILNDRSWDPSPLVRGSRYFVTSRRFEARDVWLWMEALAAASTELLVTYTVREGEERNGRSPVVEELLRSLGKREPEVGEAYYATEAPTSSARKAFQTDSRRATSGAIPRARNSL